MNKTKIQLAALALLGALGGCGSTGQPGVQEAACHATGARDQLGQTADERVIANARAGATAARSRVLPYGQPAATSDVDPLRLNIEVDDKKIIRRMRCG